jgi:leucyl aminopeptidase
MQIEWVRGPLEGWVGDAVLFFAFEKATERLPGLERWIQMRAKNLENSEGWSDFKGKLQQLTVVYNPEDLQIPRVICSGLGPLEKFEIDKIRTATAQALRKCRELQLNRVILPLIAFEGLPTARADSLKEALMGGLLGLHRYNGYKTRDVESNDLPEVLVIGDEDRAQSALETLPMYTSTLSSGICMARDLVSAPANMVTPGYLAKVAAEISERHGQSLQVIHFDEARTMGMGAFTAVAQGSREPAYMIIMEHCPPGTADERPLVFVGKGITFDTGGISLKPSDKMEAMKQDMAGAAAVLGTFEVLGRLGLQRRVIGIMPCTENMPGGEAYKPGDVIRSLSGLTIEIISTDAEGRMILCDALTLAHQRYKPALLVDLATLTGAALIALGTQVAAIMGNHEPLLRKVQEIGGGVGERFWPLPLYDFYFDGIKSEVADFKNVGDRTAGTIIGGIFLKQFVPDEIPWAHWDIAGTAWTSKDLTVCPQGGTGFGVRTLVELVRQWDGLGITA